MERFTVRRPTLDDAAAIFDLVSAAHLPAIGFVDATLDDIVDELVEPGFDRERDGWLSHDAEGTLVGWAWACRKGDSDEVDVDVIVRPDTDDVASRLWELVIARAGEIAAELGHAGVTVDIGIYRDDTATQALATAHGFAPATTFHRMRIDFDVPVEQPDAPPGVTLHVADTDDVRREAYAVDQAGFAEHFGFVPMSYDDWCQRREASSANDWSQVLVARVGGEPAGMVRGNDQFVPDENCGYVAAIAVVPQHRGIGLGRYLLRTAFARDAARGRKGTILHVDSNNTTPALDLYTSAGMRPVLVIDIWRRRLPARTETPSAPN